MYDTEEAISSNNDDKEFSRQTIDGLLFNNGYTRIVLENIKKQRKRKKKSFNQKKDGAILKLPFTISQ
jgi:hypothetical protein